MSSILHYSLWPGNLCKEVRICNNTAKDEILNRILRQKNLSIFVQRPNVDGKRIKCEHMKTFSENDQVYDVTIFC